VSAPANLGHIRRPPIEEHDVNSGQTSRRTFLHGIAGLGVVTATGALAGCDGNSGHPGFVDIASDAVRRDGDLVRLKLGPTRGIPGFFMVGSTSTDDLDVPITIESVGRRVVLGANSSVTNGALTYRTTLSHDRPAAVWARPLATGEPGQPGDTLRVRTPRGDIQLQVWIEPTQGGWRPVPGRGAIDLGIVAVHAALLRTPGGSEILTFSPPRVRDANGVPQHDSHGHEQWDLAALHDVEIRSIDPATFGSRHRPQNLSPTVNLFCVGQAHLPRGQLLTAGGHISLSSIPDPSAHYLHIYDPDTGTWRRSAARLRHHRWYPTVTTLPDGRMLIASGSSQALTGDSWDFVVPTGFYQHLENNYEIYDPVADQMVDLGRDPSPRLVDLSGEETFVVVVPPAVPHKRPLATYPAVFVVPGGSKGVLLLQEAHRGWLYEYHSGAQPPLARAGRKYEMPGRGSRSYPHYGSAVLLNFEDGATTMRLLVVGGADESRDNHTDHPDEGPATASTVIFDYDSAQPLDRQRGWRHAGAMAHARILCDATLLPDGQVLVTGGVSKGWSNRSYVRWAVREAELFDPGSETFRPAATAALDRRYHATALLLQDGTVIKMGSTGGFAGGTGDRGEAWISSHTQAEIYHPPYAWRSPRPTVAFTSGAELAYGAEVTADVTGHGVRNCKIVLMKAGAVTHGLDMDQRGITLRVTSRTTPTPAGGGAQRVHITFRAPSSPTVAPPGPYLLFVVDDWGVPAIGRWCVVSQR
jgi:hypothetical protein